MLSFLMDLKWDYSNISKRAKNLEISEEWHLSLLTCFLINIVSIFYYDINDLSLCSFISTLCFCKPTRKNKGPPHLLTLIIFVTADVSPTLTSWEMWIFDSLKRGMEIHAAGLWFTSSIQDTSLKLNQCEKNIFTDYSPLAHKKRGVKKWHGFLE